MTAYDDSRLLAPAEELSALLTALTALRKGDASVRLLDNLQFQFGQALRPARHGMAQLRSRVERWYATRLRGFGPERMSA